MKMSEIKEHEVVLHEKNKANIRWSYCKYYVQKIIHIIFK